MKVIVVRQIAASHVRLPHFVTTLTCSPSVVLPFGILKNLCRVGLPELPLQRLLLQLNSAADTHVYIDNHRNVYRLLQTCVSPEMADAPRKQCTLCHELAPDRVIRVVRSHG